MNGSNQMVTTSAGTCSLWVVSGWHTPICTWCRDGRMSHTRARESGGGSSSPTIGVHRWGCSHRTRRLSDQAVTGEGALLHRRLRRRAALSPPAKDVGSVAKRHRRCHDATVAEQKDGRRWVSYGPVNQEGHLRSGMSLDTALRRAERESRRTERRFGTAPFPLYGLRPSWVGGRFLGGGGWSRQGGDRSSLRYHSFTGR